MRFERIDLIRYGCFSGECLELPPRKPDLYILYGDNEAGKSTALRAITGLLFGIPSRTTDDFRYERSELRIGAMISSDLHILSFRRRKGNKQTLLSEDEQPLPGNVLAPFLGEMDLERFQRFFGMDHHMLREGGQELLEGKGDVGQTLFEVAGLLNLRKLLGALEDQATALFGGRTRPINVALAEYAEARAKKTTEAISREQFETVQSELERTHASIEAHKTESEGAQLTLVRIRRVKANKPDLAKLATLRVEIVALASVPELETDARGKRELSQQRFAESRRQIQQLEARIEQWREETAGLAEDPELSAHSEAIARLAEQIGQYRKNVTDRAKREREADEAVRSATAEWRTVFAERPIQDAEIFRGVRSAGTQIRALITDHTRITALQDVASKNVRRASDEKNRLTRELVNSPLLRDTSSLSAALLSAQKLGDAEERQLKLTGDAENMLAAAKVQLHQLALWQQGLDELQNLPMPMPSTVERYIEEWWQLESERKEHRSESSRQNKEVNVLQAKLTGLKAQGTAPTQTELVEVRARRDELWTFIKNFAFTGILSKSDAESRAVVSSSLDEAFEVELRLSDDLADQRFANAELVIQREFIATQIEQQREGLIQIEQELQKLECKFAELQSKWACEWAQFGTNVLPPKEMLEWSRNRDAILERVKQARERTTEAELLSTFIADAITEISNRLADLDAVPAVTGETLGSLQIRAAGLLERIGADRRKKEKLEQQLQICDDALGTAQQELAAVEQQLAFWRVKWDEITTRLELPASPDEAAALLGVLEKVFNLLDQAGNLQHRATAIAEDIFTFTTDATRVINSVDASLGGRNPDEAIAELSKRVVNLRESTAKRRQLERQIREASETLVEQQREEQLADSELSRLRELANCDTNEGLERVEAQSENKKDLSKRIADLESSLIQRNAADVNAIVDEAASYGVDELDADVEQLESRVRDLLNEIEAESKRSGELSHLLQAMQAADASAEAAQRMEEALAKIRQNAEEYLRLRVSIEVLRRAMDSYREKHQAPIIRRATEIFRNITLGEHRELVTDLDEDDRPRLLSIRRDGDRVSMEGLSDGTRDQLYLALRLAAIETHVKDFGPVPIILDDILVNCDDERAAAVLQELAALGKHTQILFFTHHQHLTSLARQYDGEVMNLERGVSAYAELSLP